MTHSAINIPQFDGQPRACAEMWRLRKGSRAAVCELWTHPIGGEARVTVDGELLRSEAKRNGMALLDLADEWKLQFEQKGWTS